MRIVDAQIHLWKSGLPSNRSHRQVTAFTAGVLAVDPSWVIRLVEVSHIKTRGRAYGPITSLDFRGILGPEFIAP